MWYKTIWENFVTEKQFLSRKCNIKHFEGKMLYLLGKKILSEKCDIKTIWENFVGNWKNINKLRIRYKTIWEYFTIWKKFPSQKFNVKQFEKIL